LLQEGYVWVDLSADPKIFGPIKEGEGVVTSTSIPHLDTFKTESSFQKHAFISSLASLVARISEHVFIPPVNWMNQVDSDLTLTLVHITTKNEKKSLPFNWKEFQSTVGYLFPLLSPLSSPLLFFFLFSFNPCS